MGNSDVSYYIETVSWFPGGWFRFYSQGFIFITVCSAYSVSEQCNTVHEFDSIPYQTRPYSTEAHKA